MTESIVRAYLEAKKERWTAAGQYEGILEWLKIKDPSNINETVTRAIGNLQAWKKRFVIYWEPQSWKTNMMIALTGKLVDEGYSKIVILINDNVQLLGQNLRRFQESKLKPLPMDIDECNGKDFSKEKRFVLFTKKNASNLKSVLWLTKKVEDLLVIDDEADYASPNSKINNEDEKTKIHELIWLILGEAWIYIGVTATPARLDLNGTFQNSIQDWIFFNPYVGYHWDESFFPKDWRNTEDNEKLPYRLNLFKDDANYSKELRTAVFNFMTNVAYLNVFENEEELNYCMLIHTSHKTDDHYEDYDQISKVLGVLKNSDDHYAEYVKFLEEIAKLAKGKFEGITDDQIGLIIDYIDREVHGWLLKVINSRELNKDEYMEKLTNPISPFTFAIGGNILSRWLTFNRLLSMFFFRNTKSWKLQQDTYIQMARMFWNRKQYIDFFELNIPESLFSAWLEQFRNHRISLSSLKKWKPIWWVYSNTSSPASSVSVDKANTVRSEGFIDSEWMAVIDAQNWEMSSDTFDYQKIISLMWEEKIETPENVHKLLVKIWTAVPEIKQFIDSIRENTSDRDGMIFHPPLDIMNQKSIPAELQKIVKTKGEWLLWNIGKLHPNVSVHYRIYHFQKSIARLYVYIKRKENLVVGGNKIKVIKRR